MSQARTQSCILQLTGVSVDKCSDMDKMANEKFMESGKFPYTADTRKYDKIPNVFTSLESWPETTNIKCWACKYSFSKMPVFIPTYLSEPDADMKIGVRGNFCGFNCAARYILTNFKTNSEIWKAQDRLKYLHLLLTGTYLSDIQPSPEYTEQEEYGGNMTQGQFCEEIKRLGKATGKAVPSDMHRIVVYNLDVPLNMRNIPEDDQKISIWNNLDDLDGEDDACDLDLVFDFILDSD